ncbi:uncharacterized protein EDB93DRAFT_41406 [Suillus bovinus]|uniref:uncharacterized protein n=1 Tax=Suillus bovinus TaxID=48563 RepID=UPI001B871233|nr:uncharacterized protein EDB93DRAFT_41406 [Suillus bovinus]KAG2160138.1 hypothetical protein EDB93DRAFT_41406 [Suillus bovinus]
MALDLDTQGILAAATIVMYIPFLFTSFKVASRCGIWQGRWTSLLVFCITRVLGGAFLVAAQKVTPLNNGLYIAGYMLEVLGLAPLLLCMLSLLRSIFEGPDGEPTDETIFHSFRLFNAAAVLLTVIGFAIVSHSSSSASTMRKAGFLLFSVQYIALVGICIFLWTQLRNIMKYRKQLLKAISFALPFLAVRTVYGVLSIITTDTFTGSATSSNASSLAVFDLVTGNWEIFLVMDMVTEYVIVIIYTISAFVLPLDQDFKAPDLSDDVLLLNGS